MGLSSKLFGNKFLNVSMLLSFGILVAVMYVPVLNDLFTTVPLSATQFLVCMGMVLVSVIGFEISKIALRVKTG
jgi:magnesium-transporting ATPase (P-type)